MIRASTELGKKIAEELNTLHPRVQLPWLTVKIPSEEMLVEVNKALLTIPTQTITETSEFVYVTATVIPETLRYEIKDNTSRECSQSKQK